jgi:hypothetical protein
MKTQIWIVYDERAIPPGDTDDAIVYTVARSLSEARQDALESGMRCAIYQCDHYTRAARVGGDYADNERFVEVYPNAARDRAGRQV